MIFIILILCIVITIFDILIIICSGKLKTKEEIINDLEEEIKDFKFDKKDK